MSCRGLCRTSTYGQKTVEVFLTLLGVSLVFRIPHVMIEFPTWREVTSSTRIPIARAWYSQNVGNGECLGRSLATAQASPIDHPQPSSPLFSPLFSPPLFPPPIFSPHFFTPPTLPPLPKQGLLALTSRPKPSQPPSPAPRCRTMTKQERKRRDGPGRTEAGEGEGSLPSWAPMLAADDERVSRPPRFRVLFPS